jgi:hypothetical protein
MSRDKRPSPIVKLTGGRLSPVSAFDADELAGFANGSEFDLRPRGKRSLPQHRMYWKILTQACEATGRWQRPEALHIALKVQLGYVEPIYGLDGAIKGMMADSTGFAAMGQNEFKAYFDRAIAALNEALGYDVIGALDG